MKLHPAIGRAATALSTLLATGAALAHPGHPAVGGPLDHVHVAAGAEPLLAMVAAGAVSALVLTLGRRVAAAELAGWRGAVFGAVRGLAFTGLAVGAAGLAMLLARI
jgi:urease accessory protein